jgi:hypothetical protein
MKYTEARELIEAALDALLNEEVNVADQPHGTAVKTSLGWRAKRRKLGRHEDGGGEDEHEHFDSRADAKRWAAHGMSAPKFKAFVPKHLSAVNEKRLPTSYLNRVPRRPTVRKPKPTPTAVKPVTKPVQTTKPTVSAPSKTETGATTKPTMTPASKPTGTSSGTNLSFGTASLVAPPSQSRNAKPTGSKGAMPAIAEAILNEEKENVSVNAYNRLKKTSSGRVSDSDRGRAATALRAGFNVLRHRVGNPSGTQPRRWVKPIKPSAVHEMAQTNARYMEMSDKIAKATIAEAILKGKGARRSILLNRKKAGEEMARERAEMSKHYHQPPATAYLATGMISPEVDPTKKVAKRKSDARGIVAKGSGDFSGATKAVEKNRENAKSIIDVFQRKPHGTKVTVYGKKHGKDTEHTLKISKTRKMGSDVHVIHGTDRVVHLNPSGAGLQVIDAKSRRILLDKGHDAEW